MIKILNQNPLPKLTLEVEDKLVKSMEVTSHILKDIKDPLPAYHSTPFRRLVEYM